MNYDPVGECVSKWERPNGLFIQEMRVPLGVVGMIYEARPNVTVDAATICLKTGNAVILRGSSSAIHSNKAIVAVIHRALKQTSLPQESVQLIEDTTRDSAKQLFTMNDYLDVLIPRGGKQLIDTVVRKRLSQYLKQVREIVMFSLMKQRINKWHLILL